MKENQVQERRGFEAALGILIEYERVSVVRAMAPSTPTEECCVRTLEADPCGYVLRSPAHDKFTWLRRAANPRMPPLSSEIAGSVVERATHACGRHGNGIEGNS